MSKTTIKLNRTEFEEISKILDKFPHVMNIDIHFSGTAIGNCVDVEFESEIEGTAGKFKVEITGVKDW